MKTIYCITEDNCDGPFLEVVKVPNKVKIDNIYFDDNIVRQCHGKLLSVHSDLFEAEVALGRELSLRGE